MQILLCILKRKYLDRKDGSIALPKPYEKLSAFFLSGSVQVLFRSLFAIRKDSYCRL